MPVERPTFSESWYRVVELKPRLRSTVQIHRQRYRGQMWYVLQDPSNNQFYRQNESAYHFVALLDGRRTIGEVWRICNEQLGDGAPTQGEAIQLLGQLYTSNLIQCDLPPDAQGLFSRFQKRRQREVRGYMSNLLFIRIPLFDPDNILDQWVKLFGLAFTKAGFFLWMILISLGLYSVITNFSDLRSMSNNVLDPDNLPLLYLSFVFIKVIHEFGHGFACKRFGQLSGGGEVHVMGIMFLVFTPLPYVDASSSWAFRSKWHRVVVGAGGMLIELAVASVAAVVWANTSSGTVHTIAYNMMFIASVSTLLFNANPLLRYDGYYILSDIIEIPNLSQRAKQYLYYLVKKYAWGVKNPRNPAHTRGEKIWFVFYGIASTIYRVFICARILLFIADKIFVVGFILAVAAVGMWVFVPLGKFIHYLATNGELMRVRSRAVFSTLALFAIVIGLVSFLPVPDRQRLPGVVDNQKQDVYAETDGWIEDFIPDGHEVTAGKDILIQLENVELHAGLEKLNANIGEKEAEITLALSERRNREEMTKVDSLTEELIALRKEKAYTQHLIDELTISAEISGTWVAPGIESQEGVFIKRSQHIGRVVDKDSLVVRCVATQDSALLLKRQAIRAGKLYCELRVNRRPDDLYTGFAANSDIVTAGQNQLPSPALSMAAGGSIATDPTDESGVKAIEKFFEISVHPDDNGIIRDLQGNIIARLVPGQIVSVRIDMPKTPLARQWYRSLLQLVQRRFSGK